MLNYIVVLSTVFNFLIFSFRTVLPTLQAFLKKEAENSKLKFSSSGYYFTQKFKLLRNLLDNIGYLATDLDLFEKQMDLIIDSTLPYLSKLQPKELQVKKFLIIILFIANFNFL